MSLSPNQITVLAADIAADQTLSSQAQNSDGDAEIVKAYNLGATGTYWVFRTNVPVVDIQNAINWTSFTPLDAVPIDTALSSAIWQSRSLKCQGQQLNYQNLMMNRSMFDASRTNLRTGMKDAVQNLPAGAAGAPLDAGWPAVLLLLSRQATRVEKLLALKSASGANNNNMTITGPDTMGYEGPITLAEIQQVRGR